MTRIELRYTQEREDADYPLEINYNINDAGDMSLEILLKHFENFAKCMGYEFDGELCILGKNFDIVKNPYK